MHTVKSVNEEEEEVRRPRGIYIGLDLIVGCT